MRNRFVSGIGWSLTTWVTLALSAASTSGIDQTASVPAATRPAMQSADPALALPAGASGVCPPFHLRDEQGNVIDPIHDINAAAPYSPKQTCGACHDYAKITEGFHFTQGKGESMPAEYANRYNWVSSPGNYGGNWCSPAPLYRQLAPKSNTNARSIDMTSFEFVGECYS